MNRDPASLDATVEAIKAARLAGDEALFELRKMLGREFIQKLPSRTRRVKVTLVDEVRLRVWAEGAVHHGWLEVSVLEVLPAAERYKDVGIRDGVQETLDGW